MNRRDILSLCGRWVNDTRGHPLHEYYLFKLRACQLATPNILPLTYLRDAVQVARNQSSKWGEFSARLRVLLGRTSHAELLDVAR